MSYNANISLLFIIEFYCYQLDIVYVLKIITMFTQIYGNTTLNITMKQIYNQQTNKRRCKTNDPNPKRM